MTKFSPQQVKEYYDKMTQSYLNIYGDVIQAFRPANKKDLLHYIAKSSGLKKGMYVLDAGCGVCGPAVFFAKEYNVIIDGITISPVQVAEGWKKIEKEKVSKKVSVREGDYHILSNYYSPGTFNAILFLESLGHSQTPVQVISEAYKVLNKKGFIYIKDFFKKIFSEPTERDKIDKVIGNMDRNYNYNTLDLGEVLQALRSTGFEIEFIKRFDFKDDIGVRYEFEKVNGIDNFEGMDEFSPAEWLEIKCIKP